MDKGLDVGLMLKFLKPEWIVIWAQRYKDRSYMTRANIYDVLVIQNVTEHELLTIIPEYILAIDNKSSQLRLLYKYYSQPELNKMTSINKFPLPLLDVYLSHTDI